jgi:hypothetical protein
MNTKNIKKLQNIKKIFKTLLIFTILSNILINFSFSINHNNLKINSIKLDLENINIIENNQITNFQTPLIFKVKNSTPNFSNFNYTNYNSFLISNQNLSNKILSYKYENTFINNYQINLFPIFYKNMNNLDTGFYILKPSINLFTNSTGPLNPYLELNYNKSINYFANIQTNNFIQNNNFLNNYNLNYFIRFKEVSIKLNKKNTINTTLTISTSINLNNIENLNNQNNNLINNSNIRLTIKF